MTQLPYSDYRSLRRLRTDRDQETARQRLEAALLESGWRLLYPGPKWLARDDRLYEKKGRRILCDELGCFVYKGTWEANHREQVWRRHRGVVDFDLGRVIDAFGRKAYDP